MTYRTSDPKKPYIRGGKCQGCGKLIVIPGKCYTCATGRERIIQSLQEKST